MKTEKATERTSASPTVNNLLMLEPEVMAVTGECVGGTYTYIDRLEDARPVLRSYENPVALDLETGVREKGDNPDPFSSPIYLMAISKKRGEAYVLDIRMLRYEDEEEFGLLMRRFLRSNRFICHNANFEQSFLMAQFGVMIDVFFDTFLASQLTTAGLRDGNALDDCYRRYLDLELPKDDRKLFIRMHPDSPLPNSAIAYAAGDVTQLKTLANKLAFELKEKGVAHIWETIEKPFLPILTRAQLFGVRLDYELLESIKTELEDRIDAVLERWGELVGIRTYTKGVRKPTTITEPYVSITSWQQLTELFYGLGCEVEDTSEETLAAISESRRAVRIRDIAATVVDFRRLSKILGTYIEPLLGRHRNRVTGRLHPGWKQMVDTGRMACREPNCQNIPSKGEWAKIRQAFVADEGASFIIADYSQMELRVLAQMSQEPRMLEAFNTNIDLHSQTAALLFGEDFTKEHRSVAKTINFGIAYGAGPGTISREASIPFRHAVKLLEKYFDGYPKLKQYLDASQMRAKDHCISLTPAGRKRWYDRPDPCAENYDQQLAAIGREGCNAPIQGCNADVTKKASILFRQSCERLMMDAEIVLWVHDEIVVQCPTPCAEVYADVLRECMVAAGAEYITDLPVEVSITVSDRWEK